MSFNLSRGQLSTFQNPLQVSKELGLVSVGKRMKPQEVPNDLDVSAFLLSSENRVEHKFNVVFYGSENKHIYGDEEEARPPASMGLF